MKIFLVGTSFRNEYGGPAISVSWLGIGLARRGVDVGLWAPDASAKRLPLIDAGVSLCTFDGSVEKAIGAFGRPDIIHDNGLWLPHNHRLARLALRSNIARIVSLRGMLEPWAIRHHRWKKQIAWVFYQRRDLECATFLHATAQAEADNARGLGLTCPISIVPNGIEMPQNNAAFRTTVQAEKRIALFISRIHPKKGLPMLLEAWAVIRPETWELRIAGPAVGNHEAEVRRMVERLRLDDVVSLIGPVYGAQKEELYRTADIFVLPTYSENFGIVVAEALSYGVPVLTTRGTPWELLETHDCGWWVEPSIDGIRDGLIQATNLSYSARKEMGLRGASIIAKNFNWDAIVSQFITVYESALFGRA